MGAESKCLQRVSRHMVLRRSAAAGGATFPQLKQHVCSVQCTDFLRTLLLDLRGAPIGLMAITAGPRSGLGVARQAPCAVQLATPGANAGRIKQDVLLRA